MTYTTVATANVLYSLDRREAARSLDQVLALEPDLVGLQEWYPNRLGLLRDSGRVGLVPHLGGWLPQRGRRTTASYLWNAALIGDCVVAARADRYELVRCRPRLLSWAARSDRPDRWMGIEPPRLAAVAVYRDRLTGRTVCLINFHLAPGAERAGRYREDRPRVVALHRQEVRIVERVIAEQQALGQVVHAVGDSNYHGLRFSGLASAWDGRDDDPGTQGLRRKLDDVHGPGAAESVTLVTTESDHKAMVVRRED